ncbi:proclotting enzyme [Caerostris darwini]|uniref:CLIP domain-containing serine protease n=1 Tax=Caerostris darwini TaxID=1538125 RepID=A0AAV4UCL5_9ARAC|nr:proclotting enzyme [Caerostris darwini]
MQFLLLGCLLWLKVIDVTSIWTHRHRIARQAVSPRSSIMANSCTTPTERSGNCIPVLQCRLFLEFRNMNLMRRSMCSLEAKGPRVCCPKEYEEDSMYETDIPAKNYGRGFTQGSVKLFSDSNTTSRPNIPIRMHYNETSKEGRSKDEEIFPSGCGHSSATFRRIVGGHESVIGAWPWMALIYHIRRGRKSAECGGALITAKHIITAAHCIVNARRGKTMLPRQLMVRLGEHDLDSDKEGAVHMDFAVHSVMKFEGFDIRTFQNDVAILLLNTTVQFGKHISPICVPFNIFNGEDLSNRNAFTAGWGTISYGGPASSKLQEVQLRIWDNPKCKTVFIKDVPITEGNICAGDGDKDACRGDSGGPLMLTHTNGKFYLVGIVSFGKKCAEPGIPGVYTRITNYLDWIEQQVENSS